MTSIVYVAAVLAVAYLAYRAARMGVRRSSGENDKNTAERYFLLLLAHAREEIVVYDDGNDVEDSVYANPQVLDAIAEKLRAVPGFKVKCLFNCAPPPMFAARFGNHSRVCIRTTGLGDIAPRDTHVKIIDGGRLAYLTQHEFNSTTRHYEVVDCLSVSKLAFRSVANKELGEHIAGFNTRFERATTAAAV